MDNEDDEPPKIYPACKHPTLRCINFYSYPSEYCPFDIPTPIQFIHWPQYAPEPVKRRRRRRQRRNRSRRRNPYLRRSTFDWWKPETSYPVKPRHYNTYKVANREINMESNNKIVNSYSVAKSRTNSMSLVQYVDYVFNILSLGDEIAIKILPNSNYKMLKSSSCETSLKEQNPLCSTSKIYFQGIPCATKDFIYALKHLTNARISPKFHNLFTECQAANKQLMFHLLKKDLKLDRIYVFQGVSATTNITPYLKSFHTTPKTIIEFSDDSNEKSETNYQEVKTDFYFGIKRIHIDHQEEEADTNCTLNEIETHSLTNFVDNQQKVEEFVNFPQSDLNYSEADYCFDVYQNEAQNLSVVDHQQEDEPFSLFSNSKLNNSEVEQENRFFTFTSKESTDIKKWSDELLTKTKEIYSSAFSESDTSKDNAKMLPEIYNKFKKNNSFVVIPTTDFNIQMKNYRYSVEFTPKVKNIHLNVKKLLKEDKLTKINVPSTFEIKTKKKQEKIRFNCYNLFDH